MGFPRQEYWSELHFFLQGIFQTQESNPGLLYCMQTLDRLSYGEAPEVFAKLEPFVESILQT